MEDMTWDTLERLKHLDFDTRRSLVRGLFEAGAIRADGFTIYQHHVVPAILGAQEVLQPDAVSLHYAQIRAGLRWSYVEDEQSRFWERQTRSLLEGRVGPLCFETYSMYILGDYNSFVPEPQESCPSATSTEGDEVNLDDAAPASNIPDVTESIRNAISPDLQTEPASSSTHTPPPPVCDKIDSPSPCSELSTERNEHNPGDALESLAKREIQDVLAQLRNFPEDNSKRQSYNEELCTLLTPDGFTLFSHHVEAFARNGLPASLAFQSLPELWRDLPDQEKSQWEKRTSAVKRALQKQGKKQRKALHHFSTDQSHNKSRKYRSWVNDSLTALRDSQKALEDSQTVLEDRQSAVLPDITSIIDLLAGCSTVDLEIEDVIARVTRSVTTRCKTDPNLQLQVRWRGFRIDYSPKSIGFISIRERLRACMQPGPSHDEQETPCTDRQAALNDLVKPLFYQNRGSPAFSDMDQVSLTAEEMENCHAGYESSLQWVEGILLQMRPFDAKDKKEAIVEAIIKHLRWRATKSVSEPSPELPMYSNKQFKKMTKSYGLATKLLHCFVREDLSHSAYHDLLEQAIHGLWEAEPDLAQKVNQKLRRAKK